MPKFAGLAALSLISFVVGVGVGRYAGPLRRLIQQPAESTKDMRSLFVKDGGFWHARRGALDEDQNQALEKLQSLSYVTGLQAPWQRTGVTVHDSVHTADGVNLYSSAHAPQAYLIQMDGAVLHEWRKDRNDVWPELSGYDLGKARRYFRRVRLLDNGDLLAVFEYTGIIKLDAESNLLWAHQGWNHHDLDVDEDGNIYVLGRDVDELGRESIDATGDPPAPRTVAGKWVYDENITVLTPDGKTLRKIPIVDCIERSRFASMLDPIQHFASNTPIDLLHPNTVNILDGTRADVSPVFKKGNILTSFRNISAIAVIDPTEEKVVWALSHEWRRQHDPTLLSNGHILLFDNLAGQIPSNREWGHSRVVEFDPLTQQVYWSYSGTDNHPMFSYLMGTVQRFPNGNTLITESDFGRAIEVTPDGEIVWEFKNPHTAGKHDEFVAVIPDLRRLPTESSLEFLKN